MSVKTRLEDARLLYVNGNREGALLMILIAVSATARKRYPDIGDGKAFTNFVGEEMPNIIKGATGGRMTVQNFNINYLGTIMPLQKLLYKFVRCNLAHEATLPDTIVFEPGDALSVSVEPDKVIFSDALLNGLCYMIMQVPENAGLFPQQNMP